MCEDTGTIQSRMSVTVNCCPSWSILALPKPLVLDVQELVCAVHTRHAPLGWSATQPPRFPCLFSWSAHLTVVAGRFGDYLHSKGAEWGAEISVPCVHHTL